MAIIGTMAKAGKSLFGDKNKKLRFAHTLFKGETCMKKPEDTAWEMFEKTGKPGYYLLYKKLKNKR